MDKVEAISKVIDKNSITKIKPQIDYQSIIINYFDLGVRNGWELDKFIEFCDSYKIKYQIYGFEACRDLCDKLQNKYRNNSLININHLAISSTDNQSIKLYHAADPDGNSIFNSKENLLDTNSRFELCKSIKISTFIQNITKTTNSINIIKANIEGAEYDVIKDLYNENKLKYFDYYIGAGWTTDMHWVGELKDKVQEIETILETNNIKTYLREGGTNITILILMI